MVETDADGARAQHVDVVIVGAGLAGIGAAWRLGHHRRGTSYAVLEARERIGGTWDLFRYPGVRSDSDMFTLAYPFRPWRGARALADGASIRAYVQDTADEAGITPHVRFRTRVTAASWSSADARWTVRTTGAAGEPGTWTCRFLYTCAGYYDYARGHQPDFPGVADYTGRFVHPQAWPADLDHAGARVVVIGSWATAVTLVPAMATTAAHVTMLQRSPSYLASVPAVDRVADRLRHALPPGPAHALIRAKNLVRDYTLYGLARRFPEQTKRVLRAEALRLLPDAAAVDEHFTPTYQPWDQRLCAVPDGDLFRAVAGGRASVVTDRIDHFDAGGIVLASGRSLPADIVVSATGLSLLPAGGIELAVDGRPVDLHATTSYRGLMLGGVPNFACCVGYTNASWTLRADLSSRYVCRLLAYLDRRGLAWATPVPPAGLVRRPLLDLMSGYVARSAHLFPQQGDREPWTVRQNYFLDRLTVLAGGLGRETAFGRLTPAPVPAG